MTDGNGDKLNRQIKATEAYAGMTGELAGLRGDLFGTEARPGGVLGEINDKVTETRDALHALQANPMVRLGLFLGTAKRAGAALASLAAFCVGLGAGVSEILRHRP